MPSPPPSGSLGSESSSPPGCGGPGSCSSSASAPSCRGWCPGGAGTPCKRGSGRSESECGIWTEYHIGVLFGLLALSGLLTAFVKPPFLDRKPRTDAILLRRPVRQCWPKEDGLHVAAEPPRGIMTKGTRCPNVLGECFYRRHTGRERRSSAHQPGNLCRTSRTSLAVQSAPRPALRDFAAVPKHGTADDHLQSGQYLPERAIKSAPRAGGRPWHTIVRAGGGSPARGIR